MVGLSDNYDIAIVGAGPAGSSAAIRLATAGLQVLLVEQKKFPRHKLCGEFISPECLSHFQELGVLTDIQDSGGSSIRETIFYSRNGKAISIDSFWLADKQTKALGLSRAQMDNCLLERARTVGVQVIEDVFANGLIQENGNITGFKLRKPKSVDALIRATVTIDATGRSRALVKRLETNGEPRTAASHVAFKAHFCNVEIVDRACEIYVYDGGYGGCDQVEDGLYNLCFIVSSEQTKRLDSDPDRVMREVLFRNRRAAKAFENAESTTEWLAVPITRYGRHDPAPAAGLIAIGDAAAFIDPFTGSGILLALESGKLAEQTILRGLKKGHDVTRIQAAYRAAHSRGFNRRLWVSSLLRYAAYRPKLAEVVIRALGANSLMTRGLARATRT